MRELVGNKLHKCHCTLLVARLVVVELYQYHPFASIRVANHDVAQQTMLRTKVVIAKIMLLGISVDGVAHIVVQIVHKPTLGDRINLIESARNMETYGIEDVAIALEQRAVRIVRLWHSLQFLLGEPSLVGASVFYLVAIFESLHRAHDGAEFRKLYLGNAR